MRQLLDSLRPRTTLEYRAYVLCGYLAIAVFMIALAWSQGVFVR
ncbi:MAG TPA: hypothetical protein VJ757_01405 [Pseudonocardiaceae bacterium]|nr:hypothetical protein [Pseudonocardiaceae bacterium]